MEQLPIFPATEAQKYPITQRVQTILADQSNPDIPRLEAEIDELVFDLYSLTETERALVLAASTTTQKQSVEGESGDEP